MSIINGVDENNMSNIIGVTLSSGGATNYATLQALLDAAPADGSLWSIGPSANGNTLYGKMSGSVPDPHPLIQGMDGDLLGFGTGSMETAQGTIDNESGYPALVANGTTDSTRTWGLIQLSGLWTAPHRVEVVYDYVGWSVLETNGKFFVGWKSGTSTLMARHREYNTSCWAGYGQGTYLADPEGVGNAGAAVGTLGSLAGTETSLGFGLFDVASQTYPLGLQWLRSAPAPGTIGGYDGQRAYTTFTGWDSMTPDITLCLMATANTANKIRIKWIQVVPGGIDDNR